MGYSPDTGCFFTPVTSGTPGGSDYAPAGFSPGCSVTGYMEPAHVLLIVAILVLVSWAFMRRAFRK